MEQVKMIKGLLKNWYVDETNYTEPVIVGDIYGHSDFPDGHRIHTSAIVAMVKGKVETKNSIYNLEVREP